MAFKKRFIAPLAFSATLAVAGMAALAVSVTPNAAPAETPSAQISLADVQIGERGNQTRIAFLCGGPCVLEKRSGGSFFLNGVDASFDLDLSERSERVLGLAAKSEGGGSLIDLETLGVIEYANVKSCTVGGISAACLDLFFTGDQQVAAKPKPKPVKQAEIEKKAEPEKIAEAAPRLEEKTTLQQPALRESAPERYLTFATLAPPERLSPPSGAILAKVQPIEEAVEVGKPTILTQEPLAPAVKRDFAARLKTILGKDLTQAYCNNAEATLQADAWAMGAMVDVGLCAAARGEVEEAEQILSRLLQYTPDNYEAYVGRALIAEEAGEKGVARKYFQDALNAPPPIEESSRIVEAMAALD